MRSIYFLSALAIPAFVSMLGGGVIASKIMGVMLLAVFQHYRLAVHPFLPPPGTLLRVHLMAFISLTTWATSVAFFMKTAGKPVGYPALGTIQEAFLVPYVLFTVYLLIFTRLISSGYSRQWANLTLLVVLLVLNTAPFHLNPVISVVSFVFRGPNVIYAIHVVAIAAAVFTVRMVENLRIAAKKAE